MNVSTDCIEGQEQLDPDLFFRPPPVSFVDCFIDRTQINRGLMLQVNSYRSRLNQIIKSNILMA